MSKPFRYLALIPAAGSGSRFGDRVRKQYLKLGDRTMLEHSIEAMSSDARIEHVFVVIAPSDTRWRSIEVDTSRVEFLPVGGTSRAQSVLNGLVALGARAHDDDRVLVHDAARPCLGAAEVARLIDEVGDDDRGGLLAIRLTDTLKRGEDGRVVATLERSGIWCAQTPQMFRVASLRAALNAAAGAGSLDSLTDEASAIERSGNFPLLVEGSSSNVKITTESDLTLARAILGGLPSTTAALR